MKPDVALDEARPACLRRGGDEVPFYSYRCRECGGEFEYLQEENDQPMRRCRRCGGELERIQSSGETSSSEYDGGERGESGDGEAGKVEIVVPWEVEETDVHRGWEQRRKWKWDLVQASRRALERMKKKDEE